MFINVWTKPQTGESKKAVMVWIVGGAFAIGDSSYGFTSGSNLAENYDVVVVSFNYRVNIFGFPGAPGLDQANPGLLDQRLAVEWTRDNIAAFGGDPDRITLFGESAGSTSVDLYAFAWKDDPIAHAFICESGSALTNQLISNSSDAWFNVSQQLGCGGPEAAASTLSCMQDKTVDDIQNALPPGVNPVFVPQADGKTAFSDVDARGSSGQFAQKVSLPFQSSREETADASPKPLLIGSNNNESALFEMIGFLSGESLSPDYPTTMERQFRCAARGSAQFRTDHGIPAYRYLFANNNPGSYTGATHGAEVPFVFGYPFLQQPEMSQLIQPLWTSFAKNPGSGPQPSVWPEYNSTGTNVPKCNAEWG